MFFSVQDAEIAKLSAMLKKAEMKTASLGTLVAGYVLLSAVTSFGSKKLCMRIRTRMIHHYFYLPRWSFETLMWQNAGSGHLFDRWVVLVQGVGGVSEEYGSVLFRQ